MTEVHIIWNSVEQIYISVLDTKKANVTFQRIKIQFYHHADCEWREVKQPAVTLQS